MSIDEFKEMISREEYTPKHYDYVDYWEFEQLVKIGDIANLFEELADRLGRIPTQQEYIAEGVERSKAYFTNPAKMKNGGRWFPIKKDAKGKVTRWHHFKWDKLLEMAVTQRMARSYPSHLVEYSTILTLLSKFKEYRVGANDYLDGIMGVDLVVASEKHNKVVYVHVTSASDYSDHWLKKKEKRSGTVYDKDGNKHHYKRNFKRGHVHLAFSKFEETDSTEFVNGLPIIKESHLQSVLETAFVLAPYTDSYKKMEQLVDLHKWLKTNGIDANGLGKVFFKV